MRITEKLKNIPTKVKGAVAGAIAGVSTAVGTAMTALAEDAAVTDGVEAARTLMNQVAETINIGNMVKIVGAGIGAVMALVLGWWGIRKLISMLNKAKNGKLKV